MKYIAARLLALRHYRLSHGNRAAISLVFKKLKPILSKAARHTAGSVVNSSQTLAAALVNDHFSATKPLSFFRDYSEKPRINIVTDSIETGSLFGGVATALILGSILANKWRMDLRIITRTDRAKQENFFDLMAQNFVQISGNISFEFAPHYNSKSIGLREKDKFISTSWWTTACLLNSINSSKIIYLLQEDERMFYAYGDDHIKCTEVLKSKNLNFLVNTQLLLSHFIAEGILNENNSSSFEPAFDYRVFYLEVLSEGKRLKQLGFYARPNNARNLFWRGIEALERLVLSGELDPNCWEIVLFGKNIPEIAFSKNIRVVRKEGLNWSEYAKMVRGLDLGFSLMATPHPSYPPLDMAASGCIVLTNKFGLKESLQDYSENIFTCSLELDSIVCGLVDAVATIEKSPSKSVSPGHLYVNRWAGAFDKNFTFIKKVWPDVCN